MTLVGTLDVNYIPDYKIAAHAFIKATSRLGLRAPLVVRNSYRARIDEGAIQVSRVNDRIVKLGSPLKRSLNPLHGNFENAKKRPPVL